MTWAALCFLVVALPVLATQASALLQRYTLSTRLPVCGCDCCGVALEGGDDYMCASDPAARASCGDLCDPVQRLDQVVRGGETHGIDTTRFCALECRPLEEALGGSCRRLTARERSNAATEGGNGQLVLRPPDEGGMVATVTTTTTTSPPLAPPPPSGDERAYAALSRARKRAERAANAPLV